MLYTQKSSRPDKIFHKHDGGWTNSEFATSLNFTGKSWRGLGHQVVEVRKALVYPVRLQSEGSQREGCVFLTVAFTGDGAAALK